MGIEEAIAVIVKAFHYALTKGQGARLAALAGIALELEVMLRMGYSEVLPGQLRRIITEWAETYSVDGAELFEAFGAAYHAEADVNEIASELAGRVGFEWSYNDHAAPRDWWFRRVQDTVSVLLRAAESR